MTGRAVYPRVTVMSQVGVTPVRAINKFDPNGPVPFRVNGDVAVLLAKYPEISAKRQKIHIERFHRYCLRDRLTEFNNEENARRALDVAETMLRLQPGPGINRYSPIDKRPEEGEITVFHIDTLGHVLSHWDEISRSVIHETLPDHEYRDGFVVRQAAMAKNAIYVTTFGEGINTSSFKSWNNGTNGPLGFIECDSIIRNKLSELPGVYSLPLYLRASPGMQAPI